MSDKIKIGRLVESQAFGHGRITEIYTIYSFSVYYKTINKTILYTPVNNRNLRYFNDAETDYI